MRNRKKTEGSTKYITKKVYSLSLNPSLDHTYYLKKIIFEDINRIHEKRLDAGGKGTNIARILTKLGIDAEVICFLGGETGKKISNLLKKKKVKFIPIKTKEETRNIFNFIEESGKVLRINESGPRIAPLEKKLLFENIENLDLENKFFIISGSIPPGLPSDTYKKIIDLVKRKKGKPVLDTDGDALKEGIKSSPLIIKPNLWEMERLSGEKIKNFKKMKEIALSLIKKGIYIVLVTLGEKGAYLFSRETSIYGIPPKVSPKSSIGCGDAFLGGFIYGILKNRNYYESLKFAVACGAAKAEEKGTLMPSEEKVRKILKEVKLSEICDGKGLISKKVRNSQRNVE